MKVIITTIVAFTLCCSAAFAQTNNGNVVTIQTPSGTTVSCFRTSATTVVCQ